MTEWVARSTGAQSVALIEGEKPGTWIDLKNGGILEERPHTDASRATHGGRLIWEETRFVEDRNGGSHIFHRQRYIPGIRRYAARLKIPTNGFQLRGSSLGFHSDASGKLVGIAGTRFEDVKVIVKPAIVNAREALENAITGARAQRSDVVFLSSLDEMLVKRLLESAEIELASTGDGTTFGFLWSVKVATHRGSTLSVELDAATGEVLLVFDGVVHAECTPDTNSQVLVDGRSQLGGTMTNLPATEAPDLDAELPGFTREAHRAAGPEIVVFMGEDRISGDQCPEAGDQFYRVFPLTSADGGDTWYDDWNVSGRTFMGKSAADAMNHTIQTMDALAHYGWNSYDGHGGVARIVVDSFCDNHLNNAVFDLIDNMPDVPNDGVGICKRSNMEHPQFSAALDIVAHEWGHGVVRHSAGWEYVNGGGSLHEGFADLIGYGVEWYSRGAVNWILGADVDLSLRRVDQDDGYSSYHQCDEASAYSGIQAPHAVGNKIGVVFRMMAEGVSNPSSESDCDPSDCFSPNTPAGVCNPNVFWLEPEALGMDHAFRFLFELLLYMTSPSTAWEDLPGLATVLGRSIGPPAKEYGGKVIILPPNFDPQCVRYHDFDGASSAHVALTAIGYPPNSQLVGPCE